MNTPEGWQLVPKEPTPEMSLAAESYASHHNRVSFGAGYYRAMLSAAPQPPEQPCMCGDRAASACPGEWEPGCDLGANEKHVRVGTEPLHKAERPAPSASKSEVKRVATLMGWTPPIGEPAPQGGLTDRRIAALAIEHGHGTDMPEYPNGILWFNGNLTDFARAVERETLATRKRSEDEVARIMEAVDEAALAVTKGHPYYTTARAEVERLIRGDLA